MISLQQMSNLEKYRLSVQIGNGLVTNNIGIPGVSQTANFTVSLLSMFFMIFVFQG